MRGGAFTKLKTWNRSKKTDLEKNWHFEVFFLFLFPNTEIVMIFYVMGNNRENWGNVF